MVCTQICWTAWGFDRGRKSPGYGLYSQICWTAWDFTGFYADLLDCAGYGLYADLLDCVGQRP